MLEENKYIISMAKRLIVSSNYTSNYQDKKKEHEIKILIRSRKYFSDI